MVIATALGWGDVASIALAVALAFPFGYSFTLWPLLRARLPLRTALGTALAADTISISIMETVDNGFVVFVPGALAAGLDDALLVEPCCRTRARLRGGLSGQPVANRARAWTCGSARATRSLGAVAESVE